MTGKRKEFRYIIRLDGGLGNQMFQYAHARYLVSLYGGQIMLDTGSFKEQMEYVSPLSHFALSGKPAETMATAPVFAKLAVLKAKVFKRLGLLTESNYTRMARMGIVNQARTEYYDFLLSPTRTYNYIYGNWMSHKFFGDIGGILKKEFQIITPPSEANARMLARIASAESPVCVHIRRGDYCSDKWASKLLVCDYEYYKDAVDYIRKTVPSPTFFVFSNTHDDLDWIKQNYHFEGDIEYVDLSNPDYEELRLMAACKHFILSNSTFSWWAQFLCTYPEKVVAAPRIWNNGAWNVSDLIMDEWHLVDNAESRIEKR